MCWRVILLEYCTSSRTGKAVQHRQARQLLAGLRNRGQQVRGSGSLPQLPKRPLPVAEQRTDSPQACLPQEESHRRRLIPGRLGCRRDQVRRSSPHPAALPRQRTNDPGFAGRHPVRGNHQETQRPMVRQRRILEAPVAAPRRETQSVGRIDVGISPLAVDSGGEHPNADARYRSDRTASGQWEYPNPKGYNNALKTLCRWQRAQSRRKPGTRGWWEAQRRIDRSHRRAKGLRDNAHHHISRALVEKYHILGVETPNISGMTRAGL